MGYDEGDGSKSRLLKCSLLSTVLGLFLVAADTFSSENWSLARQGSRGLGLALEALSSQESTKLVAFALREPSLMAAVIVLHESSSQNLMELWLQKASTPSTGCQTPSLEQAAVLVLTLPDGEIVLSSFISHFIKQLPYKARAWGTTPIESLMCGLESLLFFTLSASLDCPVLFLPSSRTTDIIHGLQSSCLPFLLQLLLPQSSSSSSSSDHQIIRLLVLSTRLIQAALRYESAVDHTTSFFRYAETLLTYGSVPGPISSSRVLLLEIINLVNMLLLHVRVPPSTLEALTNPRIM